MSGPALRRGLAVAAGITLAVTLVAVPAALLFWRRRPYYRW